MNEEDEFCEAVGDAVVFLDYVVEGGCGLVNWGESCSPGDVTVDWVNRADLPEGAMFACHSKRYPGRDVYHSENHAMLCKRHGIHKTNLNEAIVQNEYNDSEEYNEERENDYDMEEWNQP